MLERINDSAYKLDLKGKSNVSAILNDTDLVPFNFDVGFNLRMNLLEEGGNDENQSQKKRVKGYFTSN